MKLGHGLKIGSLVVRTNDDIKVGIFLMLRVLETGIVREELKANQTFMKSEMYLTREFIS